MSHMIMPPLSLLTGHDRLGDVIIVHNKFHTSPNFLHNQRWLPISA